MSAAEEEPSSSPPFPAPPARKQKHRKTKSTFHLLSLFFQRFQGQQSRCGEAWRKTARGRVASRLWGLLLLQGAGRGGRLRWTPVGLGRWRRRREGGREGKDWRAVRWAWPGPGSFWKSIGLLPSACAAALGPVLTGAGARTGIPGTGAPPPAPCSLAPHPLLPPPPLSVPTKHLVYLRKRNQLQGETLPTQLLTDLSVVNAGRGGPLGVGECSPLPPTEPNRSFT